MQKRECSHETAPVLPALKYPCVNNEVWALAGRRGACKLDAQGLSNGATCRRETGRRQCRSSMRAEQGQLPSPKSKEAKRGRSYQNPKSSCLERVSQQGLRFSVRVQS